MWGRILEWMPTQPRNSFKEHTYSWDYIKRQALWNDKDLIVFTIVGFIFGFLVGLIF